MNSANALCKPYDFKIPIAQFDLKGGCQYDDQISFTNRSTLVEDMTYDWFLNGQVFSSDFQPLLFRQNPQMLIDNEIKLIVTNTAENLKDTFNSYYHKDTTKYLFKISGPVLSFCTDTMKLVLNTNYPEKINYIWYVVTENYPLSNLQSLTMPRSFNEMYFVKGESDNCIFLDSFKMNVVQSMHLFKD